MSAKPVKLTPKPKRKPVGEAIAWTDADLDAMSQVGPEDVTSALAMWARRAPRPVKKLLKATKRKPAP